MLNFALCKTLGGDSTVETAQDQVGTLIADVIVIVLGPYYILHV